MGYFLNITMSCALIGGLGLILSKRKEISNFLIKKTFQKYSSVVSAYKWEYRKSTPGTFVPLLDKILSVDPFYATVNCPSTISESIKIVEATLTRKDMCIQVTEEFRCAIRHIGKEGTIKIYMNDLLPNILRHMKSSVTCQWGVEVTYLGHADPNKKISAEEFSVKYECSNPVSDSIVFPPYSALEKIKKGLGLPKVVRAVGDYNQNMTVEAAAFAGLKTDFYEGCDRPHVVKSYIGNENETFVEITHLGDVKSLILQH